WGTPGSRTESRSRTFACGESDAISGSRARSSERRRTVFSGIVQQVGVIDQSRHEAAGLRLVIRADFERVPSPGESIAVNGVCLTVERADAARFEAVAVEETLRKTTLGTMAKGARVHLEPALRAGDPIGGHWVQGHVDGVGIVRTAERAGGDVRLAV